MSSAGPSRTLTTRTELADLADHLLAAVRPYASPRRARITLPGPEGGFGRAVDGLEGFARTFLLAGFRLAGEGGADAMNLADWYARGLDAGSDPHSPERWVRLTEHPQAKVEAASIALVLDMTRPWIWDRLSTRVQAQLVDYLAPATGDQTYPQTNWVWFRLVVQTFLRSVGGPFDLGEMRTDLDTHDSFSRAGRWLSDGPERSFDHYAGWALHLYPTLWARMAGAADLAAARRAGDAAALDRFLADALALVGADGGPLIQGRSLIYRFAAAAPFWAGAIAEVPSVAPGALRTAALAVVEHFVQHGAPDRRGLLTPGWFGTWPTLAQAYSGPSSPYWASKGLLGLALPADHPVWTAPAEPLPVQRSDFLRTVRAPGWLVSGTRADGVVRVVNHGTDHATEGTAGGDSPLYARLGYSTATSPLLDEHAWSNPYDQSVVLLDAAGRATHRTGMRTLAIENSHPDRLRPPAAPAGARSRTVEGAPFAYGASTATAHWLEPGPDQAGVGSGRTGTPTVAGHLTVHSVVRGPWEVRVVEPSHLTAEAVALDVSGWPIAADAPPSGSTTETASTVTGPRLASRVEALVGTGTPTVTQANDASPLGSVALVPAIRFRPVPSAPIAVLLTLAGTASATPVSAQARLVREPNPGRAPEGAHPWSLQVSWPDGAQTVTRLARSGYDQHTQQPHTHPREQP